MKKTTKILGIVAVLALSAMMVSAGLLSYYGKIETTANVQQSVLLDGEDYTTPITHELNAYGGCCLCFPHSLYNQGCVDADLDMSTVIDGNGNGPDGVYVHYYLSDWDVVSNEYNDIVGNVYDDEPYFTWSFNVDGTIDLNFYNPTTWMVVFDYQVDGEAGEDHDWTDDTISQGPCAGETFGQKYNWVVLSGEEDTTVTVDPCVSLRVGHRVGGEQQAYIPWVTFDRTEMTAPFTIGAGETIDFIVQYCFDIAIIPGTYGITTTFVPYTPAP